nr:retropepsin-like aspartic protease [Candidatus Sigynarchaeota archaeon]
MGKIERVISISGDKGSIEVTVLFDSGASKTFIRKDIANCVCTIKEHEKPIDIFLADGKTAIKEIGICALEMKIEGHDIIDVVHVLDADKSAAMYIGWSTMQRYGIGLKFGKTPKEDKLDFSKFVVELNELI